MAPPTATTDHLSVFELVFANVGQALSEAMKPFKAQSDPSGSPCRDHASITIDNIDYSLRTSRPGPVAACLTDADKGIGIAFTNTTAQYYGVASSRAGTFTNPPPPQLRSDEQIAVWLRGDTDGRAGLLTPHGAGQLILPADITEATIRLDADPVALQLKTILTGIGMLGVDGDELVTSFERSTAAWDCVASAFNKPGANADAFRDALGDMSQCGLAGAQAAWGHADTNNVLHRMSVAVSLFTDLPKQLVANAAGVIGEITGDNHLEFTLTTAGSPKDTPPASGTLVPLIIKTHGSPADSGQELEPNHFQLGPILKDDSGRHYVSLKMRWKTSNGDGVASYCNEFSKIVDSAGSPVVERKQRLAVCDNGGNWSFDINIPGTYTYTLEVVPEQGGNRLRAEQQFVVDP